MHPCSLFKGLIFASHIRAMLDVHLKQFPQVPGIVILRIDVMRSEFGYRSQVLEYAAAGQIYRFQVLKQLFGAQSCLSPSSERYF